MKTKVQLELETRNNGKPEWYATAGIEGDNGVVSVDFDGIGPDPLVAMTQLAKQIYDYYLKREGHRTK